MSARRAVRKSPAGTPQLTPDPEPISVGGSPAAESAPPVKRPPSPKRPRVGSEDEPRYRQMVRTEARFRPDQIADLASLRRRVARDREVRDERITDNTLVRIAVDLLLAHADQLSGDTEDELRASVVPEPSDSQGR